MYRLNKSTSTPVVAWSWVATADRPCLVNNSLPVKFITTATSEVTRCASSVSWRNECQWRGQRRFMFSKSSEGHNTKMTNFQIHRTSPKEPAGIFLNFSQACQNKMFSALTSDLRKVCGERERHEWRRNTMSNCSWARYASQQAERSSAAHREVVHSAGVLQQLLEGHGPAQHSVHRAGLATWGSRKAGAAASAAPCRHVQFCSAPRVQAKPFISKQTLTDSKTKWRWSL